MTSLRIVLTALLLVGAAALLPPVVGNHGEPVVDQRIVHPWGSRVVFHMPVAAGYEPVPTPQHCLATAGRVDQVAFSEGFASGANHAFQFLDTSLAVGAPNLWSVTTFPGTGDDAGHDGAWRLYFGDVLRGTYEVDNPEYDPEDRESGRPLLHTAGTAQTTDWIQLPDSGDLILTFNTKWQVEWLKGYDHLWVEALAEDGRIHLLCTSNAYDRGDATGAVSQTVWPSCSPHHYHPCPDRDRMIYHLNAARNSTHLPVPVEVLDELLAQAGAWELSETQWESRSITLSPSFLGERVKLRFTFDSADSEANLYMGWMVDDVVLGTGTLVG